MRNASTKQRTINLEHFAYWMSSPGIENLTWGYIETGLQPGMERPDATDVAAARSYVRACLTNMTTEELSVLTENTVAALWARGAFGAARWRRNAEATGSKQPKSKKKRQDSPARLRKAMGPRER